jgi:hypothetical protein
VALYDVYQYNAMGSAATQLVGNFPVLTWVMMQVRSPGKIFYAAQQQDLIDAAAAGVPGVQAGFEMDLTTQPGALGFWWIGQLWLRSDGQAGAGLAVSVNLEKFPTVGQAGGPQS